MGMTPFVVCYLIRFSIPERLNGLQYIYKLHLEKQDFKEPQSRLMHLVP